ncbi:MAG: rhomboid family intramembrane serine protease [Proteobacteria bacterium]|nr:rhomboid family intramembrane serine protease [Pseudomonadota bacterium]
MLIIPLTGKMSLRNPPVVTIALIIINCIVFFLVQFNEDKQYMAAEAFYFESELADIEILKYIDYKHMPEEKASIEKLNAQFRQQKLRSIFIEMYQDEAFMEMLEHEEIITPNDPVYLEWKNLRDEYKHRLSNIVSIRFGFKPAHPDVISLFTHMFLHGGMGHLFGNMIFLWLIGCMIEMGCGRIYYFTTYIVTGLGAVAMFWLWNMGSTIPLVGASGAIAGLMGAFTVLYGKKRVKMFFTIGVYFNYVQMKAIWLLPLWLGSEVYKIAFSEERHVAYLAHVGGILSGALLGFINKRYLGFYKAEALEPETEDEISPLLEKALEHIRQLEMEKGADLLNDVLKKDPNHIVALKHLFDIHKINAEDIQFHTVAERLLLLLSKDGFKHDMIVEVYGEYIKHAKQPKLSTEVYLRLISIFSTYGYPEKAEGILAMFLNKKPDLPGLAMLLLKLANSYKIKKNYDKHKKCLKVLCSKYSGSTEAQMAKSELDAL